MGKHTMVTLFTMNNKTLAQPVFFIPVKLPVSPMKPAAVTTMQPKKSALQKITSPKKQDVPRTLKEGVSIASVPVKKAQSKTLAVVQNKVPVKKTVQLKPKKEVAQPALQQKVNAKKEKKEISKKVVPQSITQMAHQDRVGSVLSQQSNSANVSDNASVPPEFLGQLTVQQYRMLQQQLAEYWHVPPGVDLSRSCQLEVTTSAQGQVAKVDVKESSGILLFDAAARMAVRQLRLPAWASNKTFIIILK